MRIRWFAVMFLLLAIGALAVGAEESLSDARHVFRDTCVPNGTLSMIQFIIFPETIKKHSKDCPVRYVLSCLVGL